MLDDDPNLVSPFDYRVQPSMATGGLIGIPSTGASVNDLRAGNHHATYYGHQVSPSQYYGGAHVQQKYQDPILHPGQHLLQLGTPLANESSPPLLTPPTHGKHGLLYRRSRGGIGAALYFFFFFFFFFFLSLKSLTLCSFSHQIIPPCLHSI